MLNLKNFPPFAGGGVVMLPVLHGGLRCLLVSVEGKGVSQVWWPQPDGKGWKLLGEMKREERVFSAPVEETLDEMLFRIGALDKVGDFPT